jgi:hypothetical protein
MYKRQSTEIVQPYCRGTTRSELLYKNQFNVVMCLKNCLKEPAALGILVIGQVVPPLDYLPGSILIGTCDVVSDSCWDDLST